MGPNGQQDDLEATLRSLGSEVAVQLGVELVGIRVRRAAKRLHVRLDIDRPGPNGVGIVDCQRMSETLGRIVEERDLIADSYVLEVSSPGIDRPIRTEDDVRRNTGRRVVVETHEPIEGRRRFSGVLVGLRRGALQLKEDGDRQVAIPLDDVARARQEVPF